MTRDSAYFDEIRTSTGEVRDLYRDCWDIHERVSAASKDALERVSIEKSRGFYDVHSMPLLLSPPDYEQLSEGAAQRARALTEFLRDHFSGRKSYRQAGLVPDGLLDHIERRWGVRPERVRADEFSFIYGPDVVRDSSGRFCVFEDNLTIVSGVSCVESSRRLFFENLPEFRSLEAASAESFVGRLVEEFRAHAIPRDGRIVFLTYQVPPWGRRMSHAVAAFDVERRLHMEVLAAHGVESVAVTPWEKRGRKQKYLGCNAEGGLELVRSSEKGKVVEREPVGFVMVGVFARHLVRWAAPDVLQAFLANKLALSPSPGVEVVEDKAMYPYMAGLIRHYLDEEPILRNVDCVVFCSETSADKADDAAIARVFGNLDQWVVKSALSAGGSGVWIGRHLAHDQRLKRRLERKVRRDPSGYIAQRFTQSSHHDGYMVDLRPLTFARNGETVVTTSPWSRGVAPGGTDKHNCSSNEGVATNNVVLVTSNGET
jgi:carboxylate-amine ligase